MINLVFDDYREIRREDNEIRDFKYYHFFNKEYDFYIKHGSLPYGCLLEYSLPPGGRIGSYDEYYKFFKELKPNKKDIRRIFTSTRASNLIYTIDFSGCFHLYRGNYDKACFMVLYDEIKGKE